MVSVVICTYNRPEMFEAALRSCCRDATRRGLSFDIVVADNSICGHAAAIVGRIQSSRPAVRVITVAPPNISLARNAGLHAATAPLVAFMDDDLQVEPGWLDALVDTLEASRADVAVGALRPDFSDGSPPAWDPTGAYFTRELAQPSGARIATKGPDKPADFALSTASSLWRSATCFTDPAPFDPEFGACGGEDYDLFLRLERRGRRFVWCAEAVVRETILPGRKRLGYHWLRIYSGTQAYAAAIIKNAPSRRRSIVDTGLRGMAQMIVYGAASVLLEVASPVLGKQVHFRAERMATKAIAGFAKMTWWRRVRLYHVERP
jgi:succinoglycan biosynthesis protein ExoM